jgi:hypothetical protein
VSIISDAFQRALNRLKRKHNIAIETGNPVITATQKNKKILVVENKSKSLALDVIEKRPKVSISIVEKSNAQKAENEIKEKIVPRYPQDSNKFVYFNPSVHTASSQIEEEKRCAECDPKTCWGECQGKGWCYIAKDWQEKIHVANYIYYKPVKLSKKKKKRLKREYNLKKNKWKNIHNRRKKIR